MLVWYLAKSHDWHNLRNWTSNDVLVSCKELILPPWSMLIVATSVTNVVLNHNSAFTIDHAKCLKLQILISGKLMTDLPPLYFVIFSIYICILCASLPHILTLQYCGYLHCVPTWSDEISSHSSQQPRVLHQCDMDTLSFTTGGKHLLLHSHWQFWVCIII